MNICSSLARTAALSLGLAFAATALPALADTFSASGKFKGDDSVYTLTFSTTFAQTYDFSTTSYAKGGFVPVLTLFNANGTALETAGTGTSDASLTDLLGAGKYFLTLSEFPNFVANGSSVDPSNIAEGYEFYGDPTITGQLETLGNISFVDDLSGK